MLLLKRSPSLCSNFSYSAAKSLQWKGVDSSGHSGCGMSYKAGAQGMRAGASMSLSGAMVMFGMEGEGS